MRVLILWISLISFLNLGELSPWMLTLEKYCTDGPVLYDFKASNDTTDVHFLFAADKFVRPPAIIMVHSSILSKVIINCTNFGIHGNGFKNSLTVEPQLASYGIVFYQFCDYSDPYNHVQAPEIKDCQHYFGSNLDWTVSHVDSSSVANDKLTVEFYGTKMNDSHDNFLEGGSIKLQFTLYATDTKSTDMLYYEVAGGLQLAIKLTIDGLMVSTPTTRIAPILFVFSNQSIEDYEDFVQTSGPTSKGPMGSLSSQFLLLNEHTKSIWSNSPRRLPSLSSLRYHEPTAGFAQFTPVCFSNHKGSQGLGLVHLGWRVLLSEAAHHHKITDSLVFAFYGNRFSQKNNHQVGVRAQVVNLGNPGDGFYMATNYSSWTLLLGLGTPTLPVHSGGVSVVGIIFGIGVGVFLTVGGLLGCRRYRRNRSSVYRFQELHPTIEASNPPHLGSLVEPVQARRLNFWPFNLHWSKGTSETRTLIQPLPPSYESIVDA